MLIEYRSGRMAQAYRRSSLDAVARRRGREAPCARAAAKPALTSTSASVNAFRSEHRQLPGVGALVVADQIRVAACGFQLEVAVVGGQPGVEHFRNGDATVTQDQRAWRLLAAMAGIALHADAEEAFFRQVRSPYGWFEHVRGRYG